MDMVSWSPGIFVRPTSKRWAWRKFRETMIFLIYFQHDKFHDGFQGEFHNRFQDIFQDRQTPPNSSLKLVDFETYYIKPNPRLLFRQQSMQWSHNMVHSHFTLCLRVRDYLKQLSQHPWYYGLWMRVKGPHHYKVTALGSCVKWPLDSSPNRELHNFSKRCVFVHVGPENLTMGCPT